MANQFLIEIHDFVSRQIESGAKDLEDAQRRADEDRKAFIEGKISEFKMIRSFLSEHFDLSTQRYY